jgi:alanyl-tRNA synthetase
MKTSDQIRQDFLDFFVKKHGHTFVPSSPVVPLDDPTLLFTNAGMNQFKPIFLGQEKRDYTRAANTQKCIRAGGKHNDLDDVGRSRRHHTFFEMLGNWSFGDYFKRGAIEMAWELLTKVWGLDPARLHASCYEGEDKAGIPRDTEAADLWKQIAGLPDDHIHYFGKDNFWEMGDTGPCGPCTEIYYDRTPDKSGGPQVNGTDPRVMEIWNLVFIQYNRDSAGKLTPLPAQHVDTGMGFERICQVLQGKEDNYGTDLWKPLFEKIAEVSGKKYTGLFPPTNAADPTLEAANEQLRHDIAFRVVADHVRCLTFAITDGRATHEMLPSNQGRGYVLRRILRRAVRFGRQHLGLTGRFLYKIVPVVADSMGNVFPELRPNSAFVAEVIWGEEGNFDRTWDRGMQLFIRELNDRVSITDSTSAKLIKADGTIEIVQPKQQISAETAFKLHDTYGFPIDLTRIMAEERGMSVNLIGFERLMQSHAEISRGFRTSHEVAFSELSPEALAKLAQDNIQPTDDNPKFQRQPIRTKVVAIWNGMNFQLAADADEDRDLAFILENTNFYSEMGGQVGDQGILAAPGTIFTVEAARKVGGFVLHVGQLKSGAITVASDFTATVDPILRPRTEKNHTGTHIANWALREVLGEGVQQKGSLVDPEKLRFDFSQSKALSDEEIARVEQLVDQAIHKELPIYAEEAPQEKALKINGLRAVFGEKYPPMVRVVSVGVPVADLLADPANPKWRQYSIEFCGGTHTTSTKEIHMFYIMTEESVSKGVRRISAVTGSIAGEAFMAYENIDVILSSPVKDDEISETISALQDALQFRVVPLLAKRRAQKAIAELQSRQRAIEKASKAQSGGTAVDVIKAAGELLAKAQTIAGGKLIVGKIDGVTDDQLRSAVDSLKKKASSHAILLGTADEQKVTFVAAVSDDLIAKGLKAGDWIKQVAAIAGGGGGGRPQMAQGSGKDPSKLADALKVAVDVAKKLIP